VSLSQQPQGWKMPLDGGNLHDVKPKAGGYDASYGIAFVTSFMEAWT